MKITPALPNTMPSIPSSAGLAPEKLERLKAIARGESPAEAEISDVPHPALQHPEMNKIKMRVNRSTNRPIEGPITAEEPAVTEAVTQEVVPRETTQAGTSDTGEAKPVLEATHPISPQLAEIARQRRALQVKERELAEKEKTLKEGPQHGELIARIKSQPLSVLQEYGVTYDQLTQAILANQDGGNAEISLLKAKIDAMEKGIDEKLTRKDQETERAVLSQMRRNVDQLARDGDSFEMIRETGSQSDVVELIHRNWKETGDVMSEGEAMTLVEDDLVNEALKIAKLKKVSAKFAPKPKAEEQPNNQPAIKTLTNRDSARPILDRRARAIAAAEGRLKR